MSCVTVESGGTSRHELAEAGALAVYRDVDELRAQLQTSPVGMLVTAAGRAERSSWCGRAVVQSFETRALSGRA